MSHEAGTLGQALDERQRQLRRGDTAQIIVLRSLAALHDQSIEEKPTGKKEPAGISTLT